MKAANKEAGRQRQQLARLEAERTKLLHAHYAGAVPIDLLKREQSRISREMTDAEAIITCPDGVRSHRTESQAGAGADGGLPDPLPKGTRPYEASLQPSVR